MKLIEDAMQRNLPVLGICLGAQLIAKTLGADVYPNKQTEIGWYDLHIAPQATQGSILKSLGQTEKVFQWHGDTFDIPASTVHLAASPLCVNQAFRYGEKVYGLQFHLEVDEAMILRWLKVRRIGTRSPTFTVVSIRIIFMPKLHDISGACTKSVGKPSAISSAFSA